MPKLHYNFRSSAIVFKMLIISVVDLRKSENARAGLNFEFSFIHIFDGCTLKREFSLCMITKLCKIKMEI